MHKDIRNEDLHNLYFSPSIIRMIKSWRMRWIVHVTHVEERNVYRILVRKTGEKRTLGRPRRRQEDNIKMDL
jgi:hypothetical protein